MKKYAILLITLILVSISLSACNSLSSQKSFDLDSEDKVIEARIHQRLDSDPVVRNHMLRVDVEYGFATIYGRQPAPIVLARIISIVRNTPGVKGVDQSF